MELKGRFILGKSRYHCIFDNLEFYEIRNVWHFEYSSSINLLLDNEHFYAI